MNGGLVNAAVPELTLTIANSSLARRPSHSRIASVEDPFENQEAAEAFLSHVLGERRGRADLALLREWRAALQRLLDAAVSGVAPAPSDLDIVNCASTPVRRTKVLTSTMSTEETVFAEDPVSKLSARCVDELGRCDPSRIKKCARPQCSLYFYDLTRSRTARWHAEDPCGRRSRDEKRRPERPRETA